MNLFNNKENKKNEINNKIKFSNYADLFILEKQQEIKHLKIEDYEKIIIEKSFKVEQTIQYFLNHSKKGILYKSKPTNFEIISLFIFLRNINLLKTTCLDKLQLIDLKELIEKNSLGIKNIKLQYYIDFIIKAFEGLDFDKIENKNEKENSINNFTEIIYPILNVKYLEKIIYSVKSKMTKKEELLENINYN